MNSFNAKTQRNKGARFLLKKFFQRLCAFALQSLGMNVRRKDFSGARTALSACFHRIGAFAHKAVRAPLVASPPRCAPALKS
jgi:hypothetical protein